MLRTLTPTIRLCTPSMSLSSCHPRRPSSPSTLNHIQHICFASTRYAYRFKIFKDATEFFSRKTPGLASVIPAMDHIDTLLTNQMRDPDLHPAIKRALTFAKRTLNKYYRLSDLSAMYHIAIGELSLRGPGIAFLPFLIHVVARRPSLHKSTCRESRDDLLPCF